MLSGPGSMRFYLQPAIAVLLGIRDGLRDKRAGRPPFLLEVFIHSGRRRETLSEAMRRIALPLGVATAASLFFQHIIRGKAHLWQGIAYAILFVALPYGIVRGLTNRAASRKRGPDRHRPEPPSS